MFYVFDLDGTLANGEHRLHFITGETKDWRSYFAACGGDQPIPHTIELLQAILSRGVDRVEIWTGRSDEVRDETHAWLRRQLGPGDFGRFGQIDAIHMRAAGDHRNDDELKAEWIVKYGRPDLVFEDRDRVVAMWRANGVPCFQVAPGAF